MQLSRAIGQIKSQLQSNGTAASHFSPDGNAAPLRTVGEARQIRREFRTLSRSFNAVTGSSIREAADACAELALPFTKKWGWEIGANIVGALISFMIRDSTLGSEMSAAIPRNDLAVADVHTHPAGAPDGLSGGVSYSSATGLREPTGDMQTNFARRTDGYVYRAGGGRWHFDRSAFVRDLGKAQDQGLTLRSWDYVKEF